MKLFNQTLELARWREYYGTVVFLSLLGLVFAPQTSLIKVVAVLAANLLSGAFAFMINDVEDWKDDLQDPKKKMRNPLSAGRLTEKQGQLISFVTAVLSLVMYLIAGPMAFVVGSIGVILGFLYSAKGVRLKSKPGLDLLSHGLFLGVVYFLATVAVSKPWAHPVALTLISGLIFFMSVMGDLVNEVRDFEVDKKTGIKNTAQILNLHKYSKFIPIFSTLIAPIIFVYSFWFLPADGKIMLVAILIPFLVHFSLYIQKHRASVYAYPYQQQGLTLLGVCMAIAGRI